MILAGLVQESINLIVAISPDRDVEHFGKPPENVNLVSNLPHSSLLPHCHLMVSHPGYGAVMDCLLNEPPTVLLLVGGDQPRDAMRVEELGTGIMLPSPS